MMATPRLRQAVVAVLALLATLLSSQKSEAQSCGPLTGPTYCSPAPSTGFVHQSSTAGVVDMGTNFLDRLGNWTSLGGATGPANFNPNGGGAPDPAPQRWRTWFEAYGSASRTGAVNTFPGDKRRVWGGIAGIGYMVAPGFNIGFSVDQGRTKVDVSGQPQGATIDLTQLGLSATYEVNGFTFGAALIRGFGNVDSRRTTIFGDATAAYDARLWGAMAEVNYLIPFGAWRVVPKAGIDWVETKVDPFTETGGFDPVSALSQSSRRTRIYAGAELGHSWLMGTTLLDLGVYGKLIDVVSQDVGVLQVSSGMVPVSYIQGVPDARTGFDTGAALSAFITPNTRLYTLFDAKFRDGYQFYGGTVGLDVRW